MLTLYVARDRDGSLFLYGEKPERDMESGTWIGIFIKIDDNLYDYITWEDEPQRVSII